MSNWMLDDLQETVDVQEDETGVTQVRNHVVIQIHQQVDASTIFSTLDIMKVKAAITYNVGNIIKMNNPQGAGKFICVGDAIAPKEHPMSLVIRRQTWEYFGPWVAAPAEWNQ